MFNEKFVPPKNVLFDAVSIQTVGLRDGHYYGFWLNDEINLRGIEEPPISFKVNHNLRRSSDAFVMITDGTAYVLWLQYSPEYFADY